MRYFRRNPFNSPDAVYTVLSDDDTYSGVHDSKVVVIFDMEALLSINEDYDPQQDHGIRNIIHDAEVLEDLQLVKIINISDLLRAYGIDLDNDSE